MSDLLVEAKLLFDQNELSRSLETLSSIIQIDKNNGSALLLRARIHYKMQNWGDAVNDYCSVLEIEPENKQAKTGIDMAKSILGYFTPDMFNP